MLVKPTRTRSRASGKGAGMATSIFKVAFRTRAYFGTTVRYLAVLILFLLAGFLAACGTEADSTNETLDIGQATNPGDDVDNTGEPTPTSSLEEQRSQIVRELRTMMEIETASHSVETLVEREADGGFLSSDKLQVIAHGSVIAGVDLIDVSEADVEVIDHETVRVTLPESTILKAELDRNRTHVASRDTGLLGSENEELEAEAIAEAEVRILESACEHNILDRAAVDAEKHVVAALHGLGFTAVSVEAPIGTCQ
jgi:hypothetical protein